MCELLGLSFNRPVRPSLSFRGFRNRGDRNPHGWGIARYEGKAAQVFKEPIRATESRLAEFLREDRTFVSPIFIGHVRYASQGEHTLANTHPFARPFRRRDFAFAHNGTVRVQAPDPLKFHPIGETDSELLCCAFLTRLSREAIPFEDFARIGAVLREFNRWGKMNLLFSEGAHLYVWRDVTGYNGLCVTERQAPFGRVALKDDDWEVNLDLEKYPNHRGVVIATHPLTDETWTPFAPGSLTVFRDGHRVYGG